MQDAGHVQRKKMQVMYRKNVQMCVVLGTALENCRCKCVFFSEYITFFCERIHAVPKNICLGLICFPPINRGQYLDWAMQASVISILAKKSNIITALYYEWEGRADDPYQLLIFFLPIFFS